MASAVEKLYTLCAINHMKEGKGTCFGVQPFENGPYPLHVLLYLKSLLPGKQLLFKHTFKETSCT